MRRAEGEANARKAAQAPPQMPAPPELHEPGTDEPLPDVAPDETKTIAQLIEEADAEIGAHEAALGRARQVRDALEPPQ